MNDFDGSRTPETHDPTAGIPPDDRLAEACARLRPRGRLGGPRHGRGQPGLHRPGRTRPGRDRRAPGRRARPDRERPRPGQDAAGARPGARPRLRLQPDPVHARPDALRRDRLARLRRAHPRLPVPPRPGLHPVAAGRRDQPGPGQDALRAPGDHAGDPRHDRRRRPPDRAPVPGHGHAEPDRVGGDVQPPRGPARPLPVQAGGRLPRTRRGDRHPPAAHARPRARRRADRPAPDGDRPRGGPRDAAPLLRGARRGPRPGLHRGPGAQDAGVAHVRAWGRRRGPAWPS